MTNITHSGQINLGDFKVDCYVLEDGRRVISGSGMQSALKMLDEDSQPGGSRLTRHLNQKTLEPFFQEAKSKGHLDPIVCYKGKQLINGYESYALLDICDAFLEARKCSVSLGERQAIIAEQCEVIVRSFAKLGLIALIDEATGYQYERERDELQRLIDSYVSEELRAWTKTFPDVYYQEIFRLRGWDYTVTGIKKRPGVVGRWTNTFIYEQLPLGVLEELKIKTPKGARLFQSLTDDVGDVHLRSQLQSIITLMQVSDSWEEFFGKFKTLVERRNGKLTSDLRDFDDAE
ncbi:hypothetical protein A2T98_17850 [Nodularia spumigena CENA596]|jgi:hypothetical protein|uniref:Bacteriophage Mx8 p63 C-terminal domain-containing protein n=1 Tax=Nodularia spumigena CENA596 TaxID=1819295 RepID=A0A166IIZ2_NODSP|nr:P63C domain-containing protein [Nodularia spumigena]KZL48456.1 hypothetical protein A2T98_17850 [Nodularia spumigena CENA596]